MNDSRFDTIQTYLVLFTIVFTATTLAFTIGRLTAPTPNTVCPDESIEVIFEDESILCSYYYLPDIIWDPDTHAWRLAGE